MSLLSYGAIPFLRLLNNIKNYDLSIYYKALSIALKVR